MISTGFVRRVDSLGRITIPCELRAQINLSARDAVEIFQIDDSFLMKKYAPCDIFTGEMDELIEFEGKKISKNSILKMAQIAGFTIV
ncbi:AbrB family transcriptional regulator [Petrocella atlantisensis]|uniref:AbrB family transcriptional regulator n=1 Tax=Petrocella atlantisensis TaxID=2173034 RepID=A0A3P7RY88_9FIRM|nr:AbrB/MazE/SpoVT family DNA-binding domain-containing protein [Petrocella atlantisensis]MCF8020399.1 AbrB/MazE/SpoVT family DNA-binding domain-containing protein [Vallitaleaceae bacterium]PKM54817.1 MAG: AbrB family transcriptional regulator [Firmicutes bacterium HGW-Firmicutes-5]VDN47706.1 AbrB family transcriptional regulator [Petrocella atlantisensis]